jgi:hypothetical protein
MGDDYCWWCIVEEFLGVGGDGGGIALSEK